MFKINNVHFLFVQKVFQKEIFVCFCCKDVFWEIIFFDFFANGICSYCMHPFLRFFARYYAVALSWLDGSVENGSLEI